MPNATNIVNLPDNTWTQIAGAGQIAVVTPIVIKAKFLVRYSASPPVPSLTTGHIHEQNANVPNLHIGSQNTETAYIRPVNIGHAIDAEVTIL